MLSIPLSARARLNRTLLSENPHPQLLSAEKDE